MAARYASLQLAPLASGILIRVARAARAHEPRRSIQVTAVQAYTHTRPLRTGHRDTYSSVAHRAAYGWKGCNAKGARRAPRMGLCSLDQGAGGGARALPTRTLSREQHCSRIDVETQRACFRGCARDMPHARNGAVQSHMRCEAVRMQLSPVLLHGELKKLDWAHKWRRRSVRGCGKSHDHDDDARLSWASRPWAS